MYAMVALITLSLFGLIAAGIWLELNPSRNGAAAPRWLRAGLGFNVVLFLTAEVGLLLFGVGDVLAEPAAATGPREISIGMGLALVGAAIPTALATVAAGMAVGPVGAASLAVIAEKPEIFGRSLIYLGLAEGIAIYGLVVSILILGQLG